MKKGNRQKVQLSKNAKKVLAGVLATSMTLSGTMFAFGDSETAAATGNVDITAGAVKKYGHNIVSTQYGDVLEFSATDSKGKANDSGVEVNNPFIGADVTESITPTALKDDAELTAHLIPVMSGSAVDYYQVGSEVTIGAAQKAFAADVIDVVVANRTDGKTANDFVVSGDTVLVSGDGALAAEINGTTVNVVKEVKLPETNIDTDIADATTAGAGDGQGWVDNPYKQGKYNFPMPKYNNGVTFSTWVRVDENTADDAPAPIFTFVWEDNQALVESLTNKEYKSNVAGAGVLTLDTAGNFLFIQNHNQRFKQGQNNGGENRYQAKFDDSTVSTPLENKGNWTYVTVTIKSDEINVYYDGIKAKATSYSGREQGRQGTEMANHMFYFKSDAYYSNSKNDTKVLDGTEANRVNMAYLNGYQAYRIRDGIASVTKEAVTDPTQWNIYSYWSGAIGKNAALVMDCLTDKDTKLYLGGANVTIKESDNTFKALSTWGNYSADNADNLKFTGMSWALEPSSTAAVTAMAASDIKNWNSQKQADAETALTNSSVTVVLSKSSGSTLGVLLDNPFAGKTELRESVTDAFSGQKLVARLYKDSNDKYRINKQFLTQDDAKKQFEKDVLNAVEGMKLKNFEKDVASLDKTGDNVYGRGGEVLATINNTTITAKERTAVKLDSKWKENPFHQTDYTFPLPSYSKGVSLSAWVKVANSGSDTATVFQFVNKNKGEVLVLDTNGKLVYRQEAWGTGTWSTASKNMYSATYSGNTPAANSGKWTYVTLTIKNDEIQVYYNGTQASASYAKYNTDAYSAFNGGFGWKQNKDEDKRIANLIKAGRYTNILKDKKNKWNVTSSRLIMDFLTERATELYLGGSDAGCYDTEGRIGNVTSFIDGMQIYGVSYDTTPLTASEASQKYNTALGEQETTGKANASKSYKSESISFDNAKLNDNINSSTKAKDAELGDVITLGKITEEEAESPDLWAGVEIDNPFSGKTDLVESLPTAFENSGKKFNGFLTYQCNAVSPETPGSAGVLNRKWQVTGYPTLFKIEARPDDPNKKYDYSWYGGAEANQTDADHVFLTKQRAIDAFNTAEKAIKNAVSDGSINFWVTNDNTYTKNKSNSTWVNTNAAKETITGGALNKDKTFAFQNDRMRIYLTKLNSSATATYVPEELVAYVYQGPQRCYPTITKSELNAMDEFSYPLPVWTKGGSISTWVKVPAGTTESAVIFTFGDVSGSGATLTLRTDGTAYYTDGTEGGKNTYKSVFAGRTPLSNAGNWTYVTMSIQNDGVDVYYDGDKATENLQTQIGNDSATYFNKGFGTHNGSNTDRITKLLGSECGYKDLFVRADDTATNAAAAAKIVDDYANYKGSEEIDKHATIMELLTKASTKLYLGGYSDIVALGQYTDANAGMQYSDVTYTLSPISAEDAEAAYKSAGTHAGELQQRIPLVDTNADFATTVISSGDAAKVASDEALGDVAELEGAVTGTSVGIKIANPFSGKEELSESIIEALNNAKTPVNAALYPFTDTESGKQYYKVYSYSTVADAKKQYDKDVEAAKKIVLASAQAVDKTLTIDNVYAMGGVVRAVDAKGQEVLDKATNKAISYPLNWKVSPYDQDEYTFPLPEYKQGATFSTWVKVAEGTTEPATIFTFAQDKQILTMRSDGTVFYSEAATTDAETSNDDKRNYYRATYTGATPLANAGEWTYVTLSIKNDELQVYYNGEAAESVTYENAWKTATKTFNGGFGFVRNNESAKTRTANAVKENRYQTILENYGLNNVASYGQDDMWHLASTDTIMEFLTSADTELYLGGIATNEGTVDGQKWLQDAAGNWYAEPMGNYTEANAGMQFKNVDVCFYPTNEGQALQLYKTAALDVKDQAEEAPSPEPTATPSATPSESATPAPTESQSPEPTETTAPVDYTLGDINEDGDIDLTDAQLALQLYLELDEVKDLTDAQKKAADVNQNDDTDLNDVQQILQFYLEDITSFSKME